MDPYSSSGYRSDRAREQAKAFKTPPPAGGFLAPGFPVDTVPPPSVTAPAAAAGAVSGPAWATVGAVLGGAYLGYKVREDIKKWEKNAKQPFYDAAKWQAHYDDDVYYPVGYDEYADLAVKAETQEAIDEWWRRFTYVNDQSVGPDGWTHQDVTWTGCSPVPSCPVQGPYFYHIANTLPWATQCTPGSCGVNSGISAANFALCTPDPWSAFAQDLGTLTITKYRGRVANARAIAVGGGSRAPGSNADLADDWVQVQTQVAVGPSYSLGVGTTVKTEPWADGVAQPGSQPSLDEQLANTELPRGLDYRGYHVPFSLHHPFTVIDVLPGSPPVTVPDVVIDPGTVTVPGSVIIVPPGHNPFPDAGEAKEQKPRLQRLIHAGHVAINFATETNDLFQALVKGLPKKLRPKGPRGAAARPDQILWAIWDHWAEFDSQVALEAFVNNQIEDAIYGRYFGLKARAQRKSGVFTGRNRRIPYFTAGLARGARGTPYAKVFGGTQTLVVPEVHFAHGQHSISFGVVEVGADHSGYR